MNWTANLLAPLRAHPDRLIALVLEQARSLETLWREQAQWAQEKAQAVAELQSLREALWQKNQELLRLTEQLEAAQRAAHRQAAPFRRPEAQRSAQPGRPGRPPGHAAAVRPKPAHIDHHEQVPLPACPQCQGPLTDRRSLTQYIEELPPVRPVVTELVTEEGWCGHCQQTVRSTHPLQVSTAVGAAGVHLGPRALALALDLNKAKGLSLRKTQAVLADHFALRLSPGGLARAAQRVGRKLTPAYDALVAQVRTSAVVHADETSWWVGGPGWWLWVFTTPTTTVYLVDERRGRAVVTEMLTGDFGGVLVSDCLSTYDDATPRQQKCYHHHFQAIKEARALHPDGGAGYLDQVSALLRTAMLLKALPPEAEPGRWEACVRGLEARAERLLSEPRLQPQEEKVRHRLDKQRDHLFTFLRHAAVPATNNQAERQLRPAVIARKISCGNKTKAGAQAWQVLSSLAATCAQRAEPFITFLTERLPLASARPP